MKGYTREVTTNVAFVEVDGKEFKFNELLEVAEELEDADGSFNRLVIYDKRIGDMLVEQEVAFRNARGSYGRGPKFQEFLDELYNMRLF